MHNLIITIDFIKTIHCYKADLYADVRIKFRLYIYISFNSKHVSKVYNLNVYKSDLCIDILKE